MKKLRGQPGVLPLLEASIPVQPTWKNPAWLAMPVAIPIDRAHMLQVVDALKPRLDPLLQRLRNAAEFVCRINDSGEAIRILVEGRRSAGHLGAAEIVTWVRGEGGAIALHSGYVVDLLENRTIILNVGHVLRVRGHGGSDRILWSDETRAGASVFLIFKCSTISGKKFGGHNLIASPREI